MGGSSALLPDMKAALSAPKVLFVASLCSWLNLLPSHTYICGLPKQSILLLKSKVWFTFQTSLSCLASWKRDMHLVFCLFEYFIYLFSERRERKEKERGRNINVWLPLVRLPTGDLAHNAAWALTGNRTSNPLVCRPAFNPLSRTSQGCICVWWLSPLAHGQEQGWELGSLSYGPIVSMNEQPQIWKTYFLLTHQEHSHKKCLAQKAEVAVPHINGDNHT